MSCYIPNILLLSNFVACVWIALKKLLVVSDKKTYQTQHFELNQANDVPVKVKPTREHKEKKYKFEREVSTKILRFLLFM